jgi:two-component system chemotaxis response regulator CheB
VDGHKPSGTVLFRSMAESYGKGALGIVLSGMGRDGAAGLKLIYEEGGHTIVQDVGDSSIDGMPRAAVDLDAVDEILPSSEIPGSIIRWAGE